MERKGESPPNFANLVLFDFNIKLESKLCKLEPSFLQHS